MEPRRAARGGRAGDPVRGRGRRRRAGWFERDKAGFNDPALDPSILGLLTLILVPVQLLLVAFAMRGFQQQWSTEVEVARDEADRYGRGDARRRRAPAGVAAAPYRAYDSRARPGGGIGRRDAPQKALSERACGFESHPGHPRRCPSATEIRTCVR